jgi:hypothetical protein
MASLATGWYNSHEFIITYSTTAHLVGHPLSESFYAKIMTIHRVSGHFRRRRQTILAASGWLAAFLTNLTTIGKFVEGISNTIFVIPSISVKDVLETTHLTTEREISIPVVANEPHSPIPEPDSPIRPTSYNYRLRFRAVLEKKPFGQ